MPVYRVAALFFAAGLFAAVPQPSALHLPLVFEPNQGQTDREVKFLSRNHRYDLRFLSSQVEFRGRNGSLRMRLEGANPQAALTGLEPLPGRSFYYFGNDPRQWQKNVPQFARVQYRSVYPGIDLVFYGTDSQLEYDFVVAPHADLSRLRLTFDDARRLSVEPNGDLRIESGSGVLFQKKPRIYQESDGRRRLLQGQYVVQGRHVHFALQDYDPSLRLVIDPVIAWSTYYGGGKDENAFNIQLDPSGNIIFAGITNSLNFPAVPKTALNQPHGGNDVFVVKLDPTGHTILYSIMMGGGLDDEAYDVAVDAAGAAYITGGTNSGNFPTLNAVKSSKKGGWDAFVSKLDASGILVYSTYLGGDQPQPCCTDPDDWANSIAVDSAGNAYVTGVTYSSDWVVTNTTYAIPDFGEAFVVKLGPSGNQLLFSALIGGNDYDEGEAIAVDSSGTVWVAGISLSKNLPSSLGAFQVHLSGGTDLGDVWVARVNPVNDGTYIGALTYFGGSKDEFVMAIQPDAAGNIVMTGHTLSPDFPVTPGAYQSHLGGGADYGDVWVAKLNHALTAQVFGTYFGMANDERAESLLLDPAGNIFITGRTNSTDLTPVALGQNTNALQAGYGGGTNDGFLVEFNSTASSVLYFTYLGGKQEDVLSALAMDSANNLYLLVNTASTDLPIMQPSLQPTLGGGVDVYLMKTTLPAPVNPVVISAVNVAGGPTDISQNAWIEIHGAALSPADLGPNGYTWGSAPEFSAGRMPTLLRGVSVKVNGKPAYVSYLSPAQVNVLTPLDNTTGPVTVQLTNNGLTSPPISVNLKAASPAFLLFGATRYIAVLHADYSLCAPASMSVPGYNFTPTRPGEVILLYAAGFALPAAILVDGSSTQFGLLPVLPTIQIGGATATVDWAGVIGPGLYQLNVHVPASAANGDNAVTALYGGVATPGNVFISVQQ